MRKQLENFTASDSPAFGSLIHRGPNGYWKPIYPSEVRRALKHEEANFNYKLLSSSIANYRIYPGGQNPLNYSDIEDFSKDTNKFITLKKEGTDFYWTLETSQGGTGSGLYESNLDSAIETAVNFGGINAGTTVADLDGQTVSSILDTLLFPTSFPTKTNPSTSLSFNSLSSLQVVGSPVIIELKATANRGSILLNSQYQDFYAGEVTAAAITGSSQITLNIGPGASDIQNPTAFTHSAVLGSLDNKWNLTTDFAIGPMPEDSTSSPYPSLQYSGGSASNSTQFEGVYPLFIGNSSNGYEEANNLVSFNWSTNLNPNSSSYPNVNTDQIYGESPSLFHRISIPSDLISGRTVEIWKYSSAANAYLEATGSWVNQLTTRTIESNGVSYVDFTKSGDEGGANQYRIKFT